MPRPAAHARSGNGRVGHFRCERAQDHFVSVYRAAGMAGLPPYSESADVPTSFGTVRAYRFDGPSDTTPVVVLPVAVRRRVLSWISGGAEVDDSVPEATLISAGTTDFVLRKPMPKSITDEQLRSLDIPVLPVTSHRRESLTVGPRIQIT